jgi:hypothetical protein
MARYGLCRPKSPAVTKSPDAPSPSTCAPRRNNSATLSPRALGSFSQPSQGTRAAANAAVEAQVTAVVAATHLLRAGGDKETAVASRDAALAAIRSTMAALHPQPAAAAAAEVLR